MTIKLVPCSSILWVKVRHLMHIINNDCCLFYCTLNQMNIKHSVFIVLKCDALDIAVTMGVRVFKCVNENHSSTGATFIVTSVTTITIKLMTMNLPIIYN